MNDQIEDYSASHSAASLGRSTRLAKPFPVSLLTRQLKVSYLFTKMEYIHEDDEPSRFLSSAQRMFLHWSNF